MTLSKVVGDLQQSGIKRTRLESPGLCLLAVFGIVPNRYSRHKVSGANTVRRDLSEDREISSEKKLPYIGDGHPTLNRESA